MTEDERRRVARGDLPDRLIRYLNTNPGNHRAKDIAAGLGRPGALTQEQWGLKVAKALGRLYRDGEIGKVDLDIGWSKPVGHYTTKEPTT